LAVVETVSVTPSHVEPSLLEAVCAGDADALDECISSGALVDAPA
jgi:hypothetical protein